MAMTKKEKQDLEDALTAAAFVRTHAVPPDVHPPKSGSNYSLLSKGWMYIGERGDYPRVEPACSSVVSHGIGRQDQTNSQGARDLYSTKLLALRALRHALEKQVALQLRRVDKMIEEENGNVG